MAVDEEAARRIQHFATRLIRLARTTSSGPAITSAQYSAMALLAASPGLSVGDLARREGVAHPTMSRMVAGMARAGLLLRERDEADSRSRRLKLTHLGERSYREVADRRTMLFRMLLSQLSPATVAEVLGLVERIGTDFERALLSDEAERA